MGPSELSATSPTAREGTTAKHSNGQPFSQALEAELVTVLNAHLEMAEKQLAWAGATNLVQATPVENWKTLGRVYSGRVSNELPGMEELWDVIVHNQKMIGNHVEQDDSKREYDSKA